MIYYIDNLFLDEEVKRKIKTIKWKLKHGCGMVNIHVLLLAENGQDVIDIVPAPIFKQRAYRKENHTVIGIAGNYDSAISLVSDIYNYHYEEFGNYSGMREYLVGLSGSVKNNENKME